MDILNLNHLKDAIKLLQDLNLITSLLEKLTQAGYYKIGQQPYEGSEVEPFQSLLKPLPEWKDMYQAACNGEFVEYWDNFVPTVPTHVEITYEEWMMGINASFTLPYYLGRWGENRLVFELNSHKDILKDDLVGNYIQYLPFDCFMLRLNTPIAYEASGKIFNEYNTAIFVREKDNGPISVLITPNDVTKSLLSKHDREFLYQLDLKKRLMSRGEIKSQPRSRQKDLMEVKYNKVLSIAEKFVASQSFFNRFTVLPNGEYSLFYKFNDKNVERIETPEFIPGSKAFSKLWFNIINSFAYGVYQFQQELESAGIDKIEKQVAIVKDENESEQKKEDLLLKSLNNLVTLQGLGFFEVPYGSIMHLEYAKRSNGETRPHVRRYGMKRPHIRHKTTRTLIGKDGTTREVPIPGSIIHEDLYDLFYGLGSVRKVKTDL